MDRHSGTPGFRSDEPHGPHTWGIDHYAAEDLPALIETVRARTGQKPWVIGHSLAAWAIEGYLAGLTLLPSENGTARAIPDRALELQRMGSVRGVVTVSGVYNLWWRKSVFRAYSDPIRSVEDFYHSNYELELLAQSRWACAAVGEVPELPAQWISDGLNLPLERIPLVGSVLKRAYRSLWDEVASTPILNMLYYAPNCSRGLVQEHARDGMEDLAPHVVEQLANAIRDGKTSAYYHFSRPADIYDYASIRPRVTLPVLFVAGGRDRMANAQMIYRDGFEATASPDKDYILFEKAGHMDVLNGIHAPEHVMAPVAEWMKRR